MSGEFGYKRMSRSSSLLSAFVETRNLVPERWGVYLREVLVTIESLTLFVSSLKGSRSEFRHNSLAQLVCINCKGADNAWVIVQVAFSLIAGNQTQMLGVAPSLCEDLKAHCPGTSVVFLTDGCDKIEDSYGPSCRRYSFAEDQTELVVQDGCLDLSSVGPGLAQLVRRETRHRTLSSAASDDDDAFDEIDVLTDHERRAFVAERLAFVLEQAWRNSGFYRSTGRSGSDRSVCPSLVDFPIVDGTTLLGHVPPYCPPDCESRLTTSMHYGLSFASGGTTGNMKFVYRSWHEDNDNARNIAKGLLAGGLGPRDVVMNTLSSGFWGGYHVYNAAVAWTGASLVPVGSDSPHQVVVDVIRKLGPTALIAMPSWVLAFAEYCELHGVDDLHIQKLITGGEMFYPQAAEKVMRILGVSLRISTGYTSNETGCIAFRCRHLPENTFHVHEAQSVVRILGPDEEDVAVGETGSIVVTSLNRTLLPIINYKIGDRGCLLPNKDEDGGVCVCGRRLRLLKLAGRSGGVMRVGAEDLYLEQVADALSHCPTLTLLFSVHITKSLRLFDLVDVQIEACCHLDAADKEQAAELFVQALLRQCPFFNLGLMERPIATILAPGELPRNPRTGKITPVVDMR